MNIGDIVKTQEGWKGVVVDVQPFHCSPLFSDIVSKVVSVKIENNSTFGTASNQILNFAPEALIKI